MKKLQAAFFLMIFISALVGGNSTCIAGNDAEATKKLTKLIVDSRPQKPLSTQELDEIRSLIAQGANVDAQTGSLGMSLLALTSYRGQPEIVSLLLEKGANVNMADRQGTTPLIHASMNYKNSDIIKLLIEKGAKVNMADIRGTTALFFASSTGNLTTVKLLLDKGAEVNKESIDGSTALTYASTGNNLEIVKLLLARGAAVSKRSVSTANMNNQPQIEALLKEHMAKGSSAGSSNILQADALSISNPPSRKQLMADISEITIPALLKLGYKKVSEQEYRNAFAAPKSVVANDGKLTMMEAVSFLMIMAGHKSVPGDIETYTSSGERYTTSVQHADGAGQSVYSVGTGGMIKKEAPSSGAPGVPNKKQYRSADIDYDLIFNYGNGSTRCELLLSKSAEKEKSMLTIAITKDGVSYIKSREGK